MKQAIWLMLALMTGCATYENTRKPENLTSLPLDKDYQAAFETIHKTLLNDCRILPAGLTTAMYPESESATITSISNGMVAYSIDLKKSPSGGTVMDFYSYYKGASKIAYRIQEYTNGGKQACYW